jgi:hypothetical protein
METMMMPQLRTLCNQRGFSCRDTSDKYLNRTSIIKLLQQRGGAMSVEKVWAKYSEALTAKLGKDRSYTGGKSKSLPDAFKNAPSKYIEWVVVSYLEGGIRYYEDIQSRTYPALESHNILLRRKLLSRGNPEEPWTNETNLLNYCGLNGCKSTRKRKAFDKPGLEDLLAKPEYAAALEDLSKPDYKPDPGSLFHEDESVRIYLLRDEKEAIYYGRSTRWCTASDKNSLFNHYNKDHLLYVIVPKKPQYKHEKYQISISREVSESMPQGKMIDLMTEEDYEADMYDLGSLYPGIYRIPGTEPLSFYGHVLDKLIKGDDIYILYNTPDTAPRWEEKWVQWEDTLGSLGDAYRVTAMVHYKHDVVQDIALIMTDDDVNIHYNRKRHEIPEDRVEIVQGTMEGALPGIARAADLYENPSQSQMDKVFAGETTWLTRKIYDSDPVVMLQHTFAAFTLLYDEPEVLADAVHKHYDMVLAIIVARMSSDVDILLEEEDADPYNRPILNTHPVERVLKGIEHKIIPPDIQLKIKDYFNPSNFG